MPNDAGCENRLSYARIQKNGSGKLCVYPAGFNGLIERRVTKYNGGRQSKRGKQFSEKWSFLSETEPHAQWDLMINGVPHYANFSTGLTSPSAFVCKLDDEFYSVSFGLCLKPSVKLKTNLSGAFGELLLILLFLVAGVEKQRAHAAEHYHDREENDQKY